MKNKKTHNKRNLRSMRNKFFMNAYPSAN